MPPKKKQDKKEETAGYNVSNMTLDELKQYAGLLQGEIEDMRSHCNFYQKMEDELVELLRITEDDLRHHEDNIVSKDVEIERLKLKFLKYLHEKRQWVMYMEHDSSIRKEKLSSETCNRLEQEQERHVKEIKRLKMILQEKDRQLEALRVKTEMARRETKERNERYLKEKDNHQKSLLEEAIHRFDNATKETQEDFKQAQEIMKFEAQEEKIRSERAFNDVCGTFKQKLHDYYKEVTKQDLDAIKKLKQEIKKVEESIASSKLLLQQALEENKELKKTSQSKKKRNNSNVAAKYDAGSLKIIEALKVHNKTEKLALENQKLEEQIKHVTEHTCNLRRGFTIALRKVRDSAEMKAAFLERKLVFILDERRNESANESETSNEQQVFNESESSEHTVTETEASDISDP